MSRETLPHDIEPVIGCERLELHHLAADDMVALFEDPGHADVWPSAMYTNPHGVLTHGDSPLAWRVPQVRRDPSVNKWFVRWMVLRSTREIVGSLSFHGPPDGRGMLEIGLGVHESFRRRGYAREALIGMWRWASGEPGVRVLRYTVDPDNVPSVALIRGLGFTRVGQQIDEIDGPEDVYELEVDRFLELHGDHAMERVTGIEPA